MKVPLEELRAQLPFMDQLGHEQAAVRFGIAESGKVERLRAIRKRIDEILYIKQHQAEFEQIQGYARDVEDYFREYAYKQDLFEMVCFDLGIEAPVLDGKP